MQEILDMGLARIEGDTGANAELTSTGAVMGTVDYMAPEQARNTKTADARSDIYSLGITLWYLIVGRAAYDGQTLTERLLAHQSDPIPSLKNACQEVPAALDAVFQKMVAKRPADRYQSMTEVIADLEGCQKTRESLPAVTKTVGEESRFQEFLRGVADTSPPSSKGPVAKTKAAASRSAAVSTSESLMTIAEPATMGGDPLLQTLPTRPRTNRSAKRAPTKAWWQRRNAQVALGGAGGLLLLGVIIITITNKDGTKTTVTAPDAAQTIEVTRNGQSVVKVETQSSPTSANLPAAAASAWETLFDGKSFAGWRGIESDAIPPDWTITGDTICGKGSKSLIATAANFGDFELELEWKVEPGANGGVFYNWGGKTITAPDDGLLVVAPEYQIVDNVGHPNGKRPDTSAGSVFGLYAPSEDATLPVGQWNLAKIVVRGSNVEHWLNGKLVLTYALGSDDWKARVSGNARFANEPEFGRIGGGRIVLQSYSGVVYYRNIRSRAAPGVSPPQRGSAATKGWNFSDWKPLFDGKSLSGWTGDTALMSIDNGVLVNDGKRGVVVAPGSYRNFEVELEFRLQDKGNSGVGICYSGTGDPSINGLEVQLLDDPAYTSMRPNQFCGGLYNLTAPKTGSYQKWPNWNRILVRSLGD
ncbi:MAG: hypothetical protein B7Z55_06645, partial [Planctomycetales bacterium 12-60-4]